MIEYITYHKILDYFENYQQSAVGLNSFGDGDLVYFATTNSGTTIYPLMFVTPQLITYDENITTYQFSVIFGDIVNTDMSNQQDVITDMSIQAKRFISQFKRGTFIDEMDIQLPVVGTPFIERFNDHIGGVSLDCSVTIFEDLNACDYYEPEPTPTQTLGVCELWDLVGASPGITTFTYTDCNGVQQIQLVNYNDTISACVKGGQVSWNNAGFALNTLVSCVSITPTNTPTPTTTPTTTPTPTITPTSTLTPTPTILACKTYRLQTIDLTTFGWVDCDGNPQTETLPLTSGADKCAKENTMTIISGGPATITDIGSC
jgi:hypothetical protein